MKTEQEWIKEEVIANRNTYITLLYKDLTPRQWWESLALVDLLELDLGSIALCERYYPTKTWDTISDADINNVRNLERTTYPPLNA